MFGPLTLGGRKAAPFDAIVFCLATGGILRLASFAAPERKAIQPGTTGK